jgi:hypothetical protein
MFVIISQSLQTVISHEDQQLFESLQLSSIREKFEILEDLIERYGLLLPFRLEMGMLYILTDAKVLGLDYMTQVIIS